MLLISANKLLAENSKKNIYGEKKIEIKTPPPPPITPTPSTPLPTPLPSRDKQDILDQIKKIQNSGASSRKTGQAIETLNSQLSKLDSDNTKTY